MSDFFAVLMLVGGGTLVGLLIGAVVARWRERLAQRRFVAKLDAFFARNDGIVERFERTIMHQHRRLLADLVREPPAHYHGTPDQVIEELLHDVSHRRSQR